MKSSSVLLAMVLLLPAGSHATSVKPLPEDGSLLMKQCQITIKVMDAAGSASEDETLQAQFCGNYIKGYADALVKIKSICVDSSVSNGEMVRGYNHFMHQHPELLKRYQGEGVQAALMSTYQCRKH